MAKKQAKIDLPIAPLPDLMGWWQSQHTRGLVIGGLAVSLLARPRVTRDLDGMVLLPEEHWPRFLQAASEFSFLPRFADVLDFAHEARVLLLRHEPTGIDVDVTLGNMLFEKEAVDRAVNVRIAGVDVPLPTPEDLVIMKAIAHREQDMLDIDGILAAHPTLDKRRVRRWVKIFAEMLDAGEIYDDLDKRLKSRRRTRGKKE